MKVDRRQIIRAEVFVPKFGNNVLPSKGFNMEVIRTVIHLASYWFVRWILIGSSVRLQCRLLYCRSHVESFVWFVGFEDGLCFSMEIEGDPVCCNGYVVFLERLMSSLLRFSVSLPV